MTTAKYIFVTGGVTSSLGKGIISASLGKLLKARGYSVTIQKLDPYINVDPGTMNPYEHGECYVTDDGAETDLDLGHYERFLNISTSQDNNVTTGRIYNDVIQMERDGKYLGKTVQVVPHITDEIKRRLFHLGETGDYNIVITEIGGCVGDIESLPFVEAVRQAIWDLPDNQSVVIHLTLVPYLKAAGELKTKPTQHSVKTLQEAGVQPDVLVCRTEHPIPMEMRKKIALFCNVSLNAVVESIDAESIYDVPLLMRKERLDDIVLEKLGLPNVPKPNLDTWKQFLGKLKNPTKEISIALIGKYVELHDAYKSIMEALTHAGAVNECKVRIQWVQSENLINANVEEVLRDVDGILIAPGFGDRGIEGKLVAVKYARENKIPFFGICLGLQCAMVEFARNVLGLESAHSIEMQPDTPHPIVDIMENQKDLVQMGGTMRLGAYPCKIKQKSLAMKVYGKVNIQERHRHRYEFNNNYLEAFHKAGMIASGVNPETDLVEIMEIKDHPFFIGSQFHPELKSRVEEPHPLFISFVAAAIEKHTGIPISEV
ncbi:MAG: CTP synthase [Flammeovirgaceae bacterium]|jgi:CTP synthase